MKVQKEEKEIGKIFRFLAGILSIIAIITIIVAILIEKPTPYKFIISAVCVFILFAYVAVIGNTPNILKNAKYKY